ncbi:hypothetical protein KOR42_35810 [Thalassoglobus neptunius]|uniref:Uncharacterized protein n=1 Tax=Thalassoglobus neptunius TaxID=1938619 RepID=A0A5C5WNE0_9PLAN|nr:hypothetical protein [Thalassoglobus neptunius]TWT51533.1 hypothetical protein KOR42_35810 [Thalassoglobus neptunius]
MATRHEIDACNTKQIFCWLISLLSVHTRQMGESDLLNTSPSPHSVKMDGKWQGRPFQSPAGYVFHTLTIFRLLAAEEFANEIERTFLFIF